jgi:hypothetical protein
MTDTDTGVGSPSVAHFAVPRPLSSLLAVGVVSRDAEPRLLPSCYSRRRARRQQYVVNAVLLAAARPPNNFATNNFA